MRRIAGIALDVAATFSILGAIVLGVIAAELILRAI
jgi:hypothetical protein